VPLARTVSALLLAFAAVFSLPGHADTLDGNHLLQMCNNTVKILSGTAIDDEVTEAMMFDAGICIGMIAGISRTLISMHDAGAGKRGACLPARPVTNEQAARMIIRYLEAHRDRLHLPGGDLALAAFREAYPCRH
jgi:hypothetical protein